MKLYYPEETVSKYIYFKDKDNSAVYPDSNTCEIIDPDGVSQATPTLMPIVTGTYELNWTLPSDPTRGDWEIRVSGTIGTYTNKQKFLFEVELEVELE